MVQDFEDTALMLSVAVTDMDEAYADFAAISCPGWRGSSATAFEEAQEALRWQFLDIRDEMERAHTVVTIASQCETEESLQFLGVS